VWWTVILGWLVIGALAGWLVGLMTGAGTRQAWLADIVAGLLGAIAGGWLYSIVAGVDLTAGFATVTLAAAAGGAVVLLAAASIVSRGRLARRGS
jgi:uncharacterized membrane protein YeaQ/YmgE (transglycosylase-associated protein family)